MGVSRLTDVERPRLGDDLYKHPLKPQMIGTDPQDNLPRPVPAVSMSDSLAAPLSPETLICMGEESVFVVRDQWGVVLIRVQPDVVRYNHVGEDYQVARNDLTTSQAQVLADVGNKSNWITVTPLRPQCAHYKRVLTPFENDPKVRQVERTCTAQRGESGEFVSLGDQQVLACEYREPRDFVSEARLRQFDAARIAEGRKTVEEWELPP